MAHTTYRSLLVDDVRYWIEYATYPPNEIAARFHHRLVLIHSFRTATAVLAADLLAVQFGQERFTWGRGDLAHVGDLRQRYVDALRAAGRHDINPIPCSLLFEAGSCQHCPHYKARVAHIAFHPIKVAEQYDLMTFDCAPQSTPTRKQMSIASDLTGTSTGYGLTVRRLRSCSGSICENRRQLRLNYLQAMPRQRQQVRDQLQIWPSRS